MYGVSTLLIPFIALCILSVLVDRLTLALEEVMKKIPWLPNEFWGPVAYLLVFASGYVVCWRGNFNFFTSLDFTFRHSYEGWLLTALLLSGGSAFVKKSFGMISSLPQVISNVSASVSSVISSTKSTSSSKTTPDSNQAGEL